MKLTERELLLQAYSCIREAISFCHQNYEKEYEPEIAYFAIPRLIRDHAVLELRKRIGWDNLKEGKACAVVDSIYLEGAESFRRWCLWFDQHRSAGLPVPVHYPKKYLPIKGGG
jgi:hypothetical protein